MKSLTKKVREKESCVDLEQIKNKLYWLVVRLPATSSLSDG